MKQVVLVFPSLQTLWAFVEVINATAIEVMAADKTLICGCNAAQSEMAIRDYSAKLIPIEQLSKGKKMG